MKKLIIIILSAIIPFSVGVAHAQKSGDTQSLKNLLAKDEVSDPELNKAYDDISKLIEGKGYTTKELLELALLYSRHDQSEGVYGFAASLKNSNEKEFEKALKELSKEDAAKIREFIKIDESLFKNGNG